VGITPIESDTILVPINNIHPNPDNPRTEAGDVTDLAASIRAFGRLLQPLLVSPMIQPDHYILQDGLRRWTAARLTLQVVPCQLYIPSATRSNVTQTIMIGLATSVHKKDLTHMEEAHAFARLRKEGMSLRAIAEMCSCSETKVSNAIALLSLGLNEQRRIDQGTLSVPRALEAVQNMRAKERAKKGRKPVAPVWEPEHWGIGHPLFKQASGLCNAREHSLRRRFGGACGHCWETSIRRDQMKVDAAAAASPEGVVFKSPEQTLFELARGNNDSNGKQ
jgi:ParB family transcriptional regulator, chromosome partitioning protein